jgi:hypothetical protein
MTRPPARTAERPRERSGGPGIQPLAVLAFVLGCVACAPRLKPLGGEIAPVAMPRTEMPRGSHQLFFEWEYSDQDMTGKGNGVARVTWPDSARLDFFLAGGMIGGAAVLVGDSLQLPGADIFRRLIPPPTLLWAVLGRSAFPVTGDTAVRLDGGLLRADLGRPVRWRATFRSGSLVRLERVEGDRVVEWIEHQPDARIEYRQESARRSLKLHITQVDSVGSFDSSIWSIRR